MPGTHKNKGTVFVMAVESLDLSAINETAIPISSTCGAKSVFLICLSVFLWKTFSLRKLESLLPLTIPAPNAARVIAADGTHFNDLLKTLIDFPSPFICGTLLKIGFLYLSYKYAAPLTNATGTHTFPKNWFTASLAFALKFFFCQQQHRQ